LAKWLVGAAAAIGVTLIVLVFALVAYLLIRRRIRAAREQEST
jgi:cbb3-type cytochrome oxidase subunit 3